MGLFKKHKPDEPTGRRRLSTDEPPMRTNQAFSYYSKRTGPSAVADRQRGESDVRSQSLDPEYVPRWWERRIISVPMLLAVFALGVLLLGLSADPEVAVSTDNDAAQFLQDTSIYEATAREALVSSLLSRSKLTIDAERIAQAIEAKHPEIADATVVLPVFSRKPSITLEPYAPAFILASRGNGAYLIDTTGRAVVSINQMSDAGKIAVPTLQDQSGVTVRPGERALPTTTVLFTATVVRALQDKQINTTSLILPGAHELHVYISGKPYFVKFNLRQDAALQAGTFLAAKQRLERDTTQPGEYIDVRVPERVYFK